MLEHVFLRMASATLARVKAMVRVSLWTTMKTTTEFAMMMNWWGVRIPMLAITTLLPQIQENAFCLMAYVKHALEPRTAQEQRWTMIQITMAFVMATKW
jgi:hypothetical protein